jgi:hypothetical protein
MELPAAPGQPLQAIERLAKGAGWTNLWRDYVCTSIMRAWGVPSLRPAFTSWALLVRYFEGIDSKRVTAWRIR